MKINKPSRRTFISSSLSTVTAIRSLSLLSDSDLESSFKVDFTHQGKELINFGLNQLNRGKIDYADIRFTLNRKRVFRSDMPTFGHIEYMAMSARVLVNGYWGFASSHLCTKAEIYRLVKEAVRIARYNSQGPSRKIDFGELSTPEEGYWETPVKIDPFDVHPDEVKDFLIGMEAMMSRYKGVTSGPGFASFYEQTMWFGSTENKMLHQLRRFTEGNFSFKYTDETTKQERGDVLDTFSKAGLGWEHLIEQPSREIFEEKLEDVKFDCSLPIKPLDVGRYTIVIDAISSGRIINETIAKATILSRIAGYSANRDGTSFIVDPGVSYNTYPIGSTLLNVTSNRNEVGRSETVKWDAEGVTPTEFTIVKHGILSGFATSREMEGWFRNLPISRPPQRLSTGSTDADSAIWLPQSVVGNINVLPSSQSGSYLDMISDVKHGIALTKAVTEADFQCLNGIVDRGTCYEIRDGKRVALLNHAAVMFRTPELWSNVTSIGGYNSSFRYSNISSVPMTIKDCTLIDITRKA